MRFFTFLYIMTFLMCISASTSYAQSAFNHCEEAQHTGDILTCVKKHHDESSTNLKAVYEKILAAQPDDKIDNFRQAQQDWITYRDAACAWEVSQIETQSLHRIEELKCAMALTEQRRVILEKFLAVLEDDVAEIETMPRWMNVVADENPDIFWRYRDSLSADLNCDDQSEEIMLGQSIKLKDVRVENEDKHHLKTFIVVSQNPQTGKPKTTLLDLATASEEADEVCDPNVTFSVSERSQNKDEIEASETPEQCLKVLLIKRKSCPSLSVSWDGEAYILKAEEK